MSRSRLFDVGVNFTVDNTVDPPRAVIHDALEALRGFEIEAPTNEAAEHYADVIRLALERVSNDAG